MDHNKLWKILKDVGIPDHLTCLLRNLYAGQKATVRMGHGTTDWVQIGKRVCQGCILSPCLFNLYAEYIMRNAGLDEAQAGNKIAGRNINNFKWHHLYGRKQRRTKEAYYYSYFSLPQLIPASKSPLYLFHFFVLNLDFQSCVPFFHKNNFLNWMIKSVYG